MMSVCARRGRSLLSRTSPARTVRLHAPPGPPATYDSCSPVPKKLKSPATRRNRPVNRLVAVVLIGSWMLSGTIARAQTAPPQGANHGISDQDLNLLRKDLRSTKEQRSAANLKLTDSEAARF